MMNSLDIELHCKGCNIVKPLTEFHKRKGSPNGVRKRCKQCCNKVYRDWYSRDNERRRKVDNAYRSRNRGVVRLSNASWKRKNKGSVAGYTAKRRASLLSRTPSWADLDKIKVFYQAAKAMDYFNPCEKHHVDHIVPLQGVNVSGLHIQNNLQILTASENTMKGNRY